MICVSSYFSFVTGEQVKGAELILFCLSVTSVDHIHMLKSEP